MLTALEFDPDDRLQPTLLHKQVFHPALPGLAFVGHYRGPYFPVMELQSRWIAGILAGEIALPSEQAMHEGIEDERRIRTARPRPQFPHGDFVGLADGLAREVGVLPPMSPDHPLHAYIARGPVIAAHYRLVGPHARPDLAAETIRATPSPLIETARHRISEGHRTTMRGSPAERVMAMLRGQLVDRADGGPGWSFRWDRMLHRNAGSAFDAC